MHMFNRALCATLMLACAPAAADVKTGAWSGASQDQRDWLGRQQSPFGISCCGLGDAIVVDIIGSSEKSIRLLVIDGKGHIKNGREIDAPRSALISPAGDPNVWGETIAWASTEGHVYCVAQAPMI